MTNQGLLHRTVGLVLGFDVRCHGAPPLLPARRDLFIIVFFAETISLPENAFDRDCALTELMNITRLSEAIEKVMHTDHD